MSLMELGLGALIVVVLISARCMENEMAVTRQALAAIQHRLDHSDEVLCELSHVIEERIAILGGIRYQLEQSNSALWDIREILINPSNQKVVSLMRLVEEQESEK